jgi:RNA polymerase sigma-70 factor (ECF subfamily)
MLMPLVYDELRRLARHYMHHENRGCSLQATAIVHDAYLKLVDQSSARYHDRVHFFAVAAQAMRRVLIDHARSRHVRKRHVPQRLSVRDSVPDAPHADIDLIALDEALRKLASLHERQALIVELRYFGGLEIKDIAHVLCVSPRTVDGDWAMARAWLKRELQDGCGHARAGGSGR